MNRNNGVAVGSRIVSLSLILSLGLLSHVALAASADEVSSTEVLQEDLLPKDSFESEESATLFPTEEPSLGELPPEESLAGEEPSGDLFPEQVAPENLLPEEEPLEEEPVEDPATFPPATQAPSMEVSTPGLGTVSQIPVRAFAAKALIRGTTRIGGANRYQTAVELSRRLVPQKGQLSSLFVASGSVYADGLSLGALAAHAGSPLLLSAKDSLPQIVADEIRQLASSTATVYIAGGPASVSDHVLSQIADAVGPQGKVERLAGKDRYGTSLAIAQKFPQGSAVMLTTGLNYPDALVASAASSKVGGVPVILTPGATLDSNAVAALRFSEPQTAYLVGGTWSASEIARIKAAGSGSTVIRLTGPDRYTTSAVVAQRFWSNTPGKIIYASGGTYADAMTAGPASKALSAPVLLTTKACRPKSLGRVASAQSAVLVFGGNNTIAAGAERITCPLLPSKVSLSGGTYRFGMSWVGQERNYWCGPAAGYMILQRLGYSRSAQGVSLSQNALATDRYMATDSWGRTAWVANKVSVGLNNWMGRNVYQQYGSPTSAVFRDKVKASFLATGRPVVVDTEEFAGGPHYNGHPRGSYISHLMPVESYNPSTDTIQILDPASHYYYGSGAQNLFSHNVEDFGKYLRPFGIYY